MALIINADDFGIDPGIDEGILLTHRGKVVTSTSFFVNFESSVESAKVLRKVPSIGIGLHFDLTWGRLLTYNGRYPHVRSKIWLCSRRMSALAKRELAAQIERFMKLLGRLPDHLDSHQHIHFFPNVASAMLTIAADYKIPAVRRLVMPSFMISPKALILRAADSLVRCPSKVFRPQATLGLGSKPLDEEKLVSWLGRLPGEVTWELVCHPGAYSSSGLLSSSQIERRKKDLSVLLSPRIKECFQKVKLVCFSDC